MTAVLNLFCSMLHIKGQFVSFVAPSSQSLQLPVSLIVLGPGLLSMVEELLCVLFPFLDPAQGPAPFKLTFAGHSLGGSLAALLCCLVHTRLHTPASQLRCFTFGSPPALSLASASGASDILQACYA